jgi:hypothetical protein
MYSSLPHFVIGFHGCDKSVAKCVVARKDPHLIFSKNKYDWLGSGVYFWEQNYQRAIDWAKDPKNIHPINSKPIKAPAAIGAIIDLGKCLNLLDGKSIEVVKRTHELTMDLFNTAKNTTPKNTKKGRFLDCAVINSVNTVFGEEYDTIRGMFPEGYPVYETSGILDKSHIQICVRNLNCIKGYFHPIDKDCSFEIP